MKFNKINKSRKGKAFTITHEGGKSYDLSYFSNEDVKRLDRYLNTSSLFLADDTLYTSVSDDVEKVITNIKEEPIK